MKAEELKNKLKNEKATKIDPLDYKFALDDEDQERFDLVYYATRLVSNQQAKGFLPILFRQERKINELKDDIEQIKIILRELIKDDSE